MKMTDRRKVEALLRKYDEQHARVALLQADALNSIGVTYNGRYQDEHIVKLAIPVLLEYERKVLNAIVNDLAVLGVK